MHSLLYAIFLFLKENVDSNSRIFCSVFLNSITETTLKIYLLSLLILVILCFLLQEEPPDYDVSRITAPVALMWSTNDKIADPIDVEYLRGNIKPLIFDYQVPYPYDHFDFVLALNTADMINKPIIQLLSRSKV